MLLLRTFPEIVYPETLRKIADIADKYGAAALKVTSAQRIAIVGLKEEDLDAAWGELGMSGSCHRSLCQERQNLPGNHIL
ncbi:hypothetical protein [Methanosarcina horonobensis]|uniref:hypothetical protein n=1 Tax=Methanosarcina horonobensis TaxID=418008 RepID=UPI000A7A44DB|nr:hypothetical protein [Methanosarcina horonobensis]